MMVCDYLETMAGGFGRGHRRGPGTGHRGSECQRSHGSGRTFYYM